MPSRASAIAGSKSVGQGTRPYVRWAVSMPATVPGTATDATPIPNDCVVEPSKSTSIVSISLIAPGARPAPGTETKKSKRRERPSRARWTSRKPPPPGPVSGLSATHETNAAARHASTAFPPSASTCAPASAVSGWPAAIAPLIVLRVLPRPRRRPRRLVLAGRLGALQEGGRLQRLAPLRDRRRVGRTAEAAPLSHPGDDHG